MHCRLLVSLLSLALLAGAAVAQDRQTIPHSHVAHGLQDIAAAWLSEPTTRYGHGVLGDDIEAASLMVEREDGKVQRVRLVDNSVFEDLLPRLADIDNDGRDEVWVVRSDVRAGARLEAYALVDGKLIRRYATAPIGTGYRWLNPIGIADFDGDGRREAAYVQTPHIGGVLTIVQNTGSQLRPLARAHGYSNHAMGSTRLDLAAIADLDARPGADIVLPDQSRRRLVVVTLMGGQLVERWRAPPGPPVSGGLTLRRRGNDWVANYRTNAGTLASVRIPVAALK